MQCVVHGQRLDHLPSRLPENVSLGEGHQVLLEEGVDPVLGADDLLANLLVRGEERAQGLDLGIRLVDRLDQLLFTGQLHFEEDGQFLRVNLVGLLLDHGDQLELEGVGNEHLFDLWLDELHELEGVGGRLDHDRSVPVEQLVEIIEPGGGELKNPGNRLPCILQKTAGELVGMQIDTQIGHNNLLMKKCFQ